MIQSCHNFAHAMTAQLSCHVQNCDVIGSLKCKLEPRVFSQDFNYDLIKTWCNNPRNLHPPLITSPSYKKSKSSPTMTCPTPHPTPHLLPYLQIFIEFDNLWINNSDRTDNVWTPGYICHDTDLTIIHRIASQQGRSTVYTGFKQRIFQQCIFHAERLISYDLAQKQIVFNSWRTCYV